MITGLELLIITVVSVGLGWCAASLWLDYDTARSIDFGYQDGYTDGYNAANADARSDADGQAHRPGTYEAPF